MTLHRRRACHLAAFAALQDHVQDRGMNGTGRYLALSPYWSRELQALSHIVRLMPPAYVSGQLRCYRAIGAADATNGDAYCSNCNVKLTATQRLKPSRSAKSHLGR